MEALSQAIVNKVLHAPMVKLKDSSRAGPRPAMDGDDLGAVRAARPRPTRLARMKIRLGTRGSRLALVQSEAVAAALRARGAEVEIVVIRTTGDRLAQVALADFGGKALFVKEIEEALLAGQRGRGRAQPQGHARPSCPDGLTLAAFPLREDPCDVLLGRRDGRMGRAARGRAWSGRRACGAAPWCSRAARISAPSRSAATWTRASRSSRAGAYDALVMAAAGLKRLGLSPAHATPLDPAEFVPAVGQGMLAVEARQADRELLEVLRAVDDTRTRLGGPGGAGIPGPAGGRMPHAGGRARAAGRRDPGADRGRVEPGRSDRAAGAATAGPPGTAERLGVALADELMAKGAKAVLDASRG